MFYNLYAYQIKQIMKLKLKCKLIKTIKIIHTKRTRNYED